MKDSWEPVKSFDTKSEVTALTSWWKFLFVHHRWSVEVFADSAPLPRRIVRVPLPGLYRRTYTRAWWR